METSQRELPALYDCEIVEAETSEMLFRLCTTCRGKVVLAASDPYKGKEAYYCPQCDVLNPTCTANIQLKVLIRQGDQLDSLEIYESVLLPLLGCSIEELLERVEEEPDLLVRLEFLLIGKLFDIVVHPRTKRVLAMEPHRPELFFPATHPSQN